LEAAFSNAAEAAGTWLAMPHKVCYEAKKCRAGNGFFAGLTAALPDVPEFLLRFRAEAANRSRLWGESFLGTITS